MFSSIKEGGIVDRQAGGSPSGARECVEDYVKKHDVHRSAVFLRAQGVGLTGAACLLWHSCRYMERLKRESVRRYIEVEVL